MSEKKTLAVIGAGSRGLHSYAPFLLEHPDRGKIVAVAEPREGRRKEMQRLHEIPDEMAFTDWRELFSQERLADGVLICTSDSDHVEPALAAVEKGYHILLEKPMAPTALECLRISEAAREKGVLFAVCHVLRYTPFHRTVKEVIDSGELGEIATIQHCEGVGWSHQAHSYVRGNWRNTAESSFMLLAKSCHDLDLINWWMDAPCKSVASFGHLKHFKSSERPAEATDRCVDCPLSGKGCPYSAAEFYREHFRHGNDDWPLNVILDEFTEENLEKALREGPYGRCVYACDNDAVDNQVVILDFANGTTASFTMTAFTPGGRMLRIMGTHGYLEGGYYNSIRVLNFRTNEWRDVLFNEGSDDVAGGHGGGDAGVMDHFLNALEKNDPQYIKTGIDQTLESHLLVFAAEQARIENRIIDMDEFLGETHRESHAKQAEHGIK